MTGERVTIAQVCAGIDQLHADAKPDATDPHTAMVARLRQLSTEIAWAEDLWPGITGWTPEDAATLADYLEGNP